MELQDPKALDDVDGRPDGYVEVAGDLVPVDSDGCFEHPAISREWAEGYARREGVDVGVVLTDESADADAGDSSGAPTCVGKGGECSREVDEPGDTCWQHPADDEE